MDWDVFVRVIDNHGDIGVCWRLARELAGRGHGLRLWVDEPSALRWMAPGGHPGVQVLHWTAETAAPEPGDVTIEAFGCDPPAAHLAQLAARKACGGRQPAWINLEYLSAEGYVERCHGLPSPVSSGPGAGLLKHFFYPGFTPRTGGLLRERDLAARQAGFDADAWLRSMGVPPAGGRRVSLFCYEPPGLGELLDQLARGPDRTQLLVTAGRAQTAVEAALARPSRCAPEWNAGARLAIHPLPLLSQADYDHLLWSCDLNFVRGEDSLVRAIWAAKPFVWQIYPQQDGAHHAKLRAFLDWLQPAPGLRAFHLAWNGTADRPLPPLEPGSWAESCLQARARALAGPELAAALERFVLDQGRI